MSLAGRPKARTAAEAYEEPQGRLGIKRWFVRGPADGSELTIYARNEKMARRRMNRITKQSRRRNRHA